MFQLRNEIVATAPFCPLGGEAAHVEVVDGAGCQDAAEEHDQNAVDVVTGDEKPDAEGEGKYGEPTGGEHAWAF